LGKYRHNPDIALYDRSGREGLQTRQDGTGLPENRTNQKHSNAMKDPKLGDYLLWDGKLAKIVSTSDQPMVGIQLIGEHYCPHCGEILPQELVWMIPSSPLFQDKATAIQAMQDDPTLILHKP
jgi:hypothetical protein